MNFATIGLCLVLILMLILILITKGGDDDTNE